MMTIIIPFLVLLSFSASALTLVKNRPSAEGSSTHRFTLTSESATAERNSNLFEKGLKDRRIGKFRTSSKKFKEAFNSLTILDKKLKIVDGILRQKGTSFNEVAGAAPRGPLFLMGEFRILSTSSYYAELETIFSQLQGLKWELEEGYELSDDLSRVKVYSAGKIKKSEKYLRVANCLTLVKACTYESGGLVYLP
jgi:hypothetical protein